MSKYSKLWEYIVDNMKEREEMVLSFEEVEKVCGFSIDHSFLNYKKELIDFGYRVDKISLKGKNMIIKRT